MSPACSVGQLDDALHVDTGGVHVVGVQLARLHEVLDLGDGDPPAHRGQRVEVARGVAVDEVAVPVALPGPDQAEVGDQGLLEHELLVALGGREDPDLLGGRGDRDVAGVVVLPRQAALGDLGADAGGGEEGGDARAAGPHPLRQGALRGQLDLELAGEVLPGELLVLPDVRRHHPAQPLLHQQPPEAPVVDAAVVGDRLQVARALRQQGVDQHRRDAAQAEAADREGRSRADVLHRSGGAAHHLVHVTAPSVSPRSVVGCPARPIACDPSHGRAGLTAARGGPRLPRVSTSGSSDWPRVDLHVVTGKGGTGKSTVAAALALALASTGKNVLLCEVEGRQGIAQMFDVDPLPYEERRIARGLAGPRARAGNVFALHIDAESALLEYLAMYYRLGRAGRALDRFGVIDFATTIAPGVRDVLLTGKLFEAARSNRRKGPRAAPAWSTTRSCSTLRRPVGSPSSSTSTASSPGSPRSGRSRTRPTR